MAALAAEPLAPSEPIAELSSLPPDVLIHVAIELVPPGGLSDSFASWSAAMNFTSASHLMHSALVNAIHSRVPTATDGLSFSPAGLCAHIHSLLAGGGLSKWRILPPLHTVRAPKSMHLLPLHAPPKLSGASLCCVAPQHLCLFGGRVSSSGDTLDTTYFATVRSGVTIWDQLLTLADVPRPPARCYHTGTVLESAPPSPRRPKGTSRPMIVFGGAGAGDSGNDDLLSDVWILVDSCWRELRPHGPPPVARSSHICAAWPAERALIFHGGLAADGVRGDVFLLRGVAERRAGSCGAGSCGGDTRADGEWVAVTTSGVAARRAHHSGGVVSEATLLIFCGQDETLLTRHVLSALDLRTFTWSSTPLLTDPPGTAALSPLAAMLARHAHSSVGPAARIDGAGMAISGVGLVVFGGVSEDFSFVAAEDAWLIRSATDVQPRGRLAYRTTPRGSSDPRLASDSKCALARPEGPCPRACLGLCVDGLTVYVCGGFDGEQDLNDLWSLELLPRRGGDQPEEARPHGSRPHGSRPTAHATRHAAGQDDAFNVDAFKARQARASAVLHATPTANDVTGTPIHLLVYDAWAGSGSRSGSRSGSGRLRDCERRSGRASRRE